MTRNYRRPQGLRRPGRLAALAIASVLVASAAAAQSRVTSLDAEPLDWFGWDLATTKRMTVVGSWRDDDAGPETGSAHLVYTPETSAPAYLQKLVLPDAAAGDRAGFKVAIGEDIIAISAPGKPMPRSGGATVSGTVAIFRELGGVWTQVAQLDDPRRSEGDLFGSSIAFEGDYVLVGAPRDDQFSPDGGAIYVFAEVGGMFAVTQKFAPADNGQHDYFGHDLAASGGRAVVTAYNDDDRGVNAGAAYCLELGGNGWQITQKLLASEGDHFDFFGTSAAMIDEIIVIGAPQNEDTDAEAKINEGAVFVFEWSTRDGRWVATMVLRPGDPNDEHRFGIDVAIGEDVIVVGASHSDLGLLNSGSAHVFRQRQRDWFETFRHTAAAPQAYDYLGLTVAVGDSILVGVPGANDAELGAGAIDVVPIDLSPSTWGQTQCHGSERVGGFKIMGGPVNAVGTPGRLTPAGSNSVSRDDLVLRATGLPPGAYGILLLGGSSTKSDLGDGQLCVGSGSMGYRFATEIIPADGRLIRRHPVGAIEAASPGAAAAIVGQRMFAQVAYYDPAIATWNTTNSLRIDFDN